MIRQQPLQSVKQTSSSINAGNCSHHTWGLNKTSCKYGSVEAARVFQRTHQQIITPLWLLTVHGTRWQLSCGAAETSDIFCPCMVNAPLSCSTPTSHQGWLWVYKLLVLCCDFLLQSVSLNSNPLNCNHKIWWPTCWYIVTAFNYCTSKQWNVSQFISTSYNYRWIFF